MVDWTQNDQMQQSAQN